LAPGFERIYLPGEKGFLESNKRTSQGIPLDVRMVEQLEALALELNVSKLNSLNSTE
jgi:LDH2 family malate/lactate/ureidoglycolate dehydrogenase